MEIEPEGVPAQITHVTPTLEVEMNKQAGDVCFELFYLHVSNHDTVLYNSDLESHQISWVSSLVGLAMLSSTWFPPPNLFLVKGHMSNIQTSTKAKLILSNLESFSILSLTGCKERCNLGAEVSGRDKTRLSVSVSRSLKCT